MIRLENSKETYASIDNALKEIEESIIMTRDAGKKFCSNNLPEDDCLGNLLTCQSDLKLSMRHFNQLIEDLMMEIQEAERLICEEEDCRIEGEYYDEGQCRIKE